MNYSPKDYKMNYLPKDYSNFIELNEFFAKKVTLLNECLELKGMDEQGKAFFWNFQNSVVELRNLFQDINLEIKKGQDQLIEMKALLKKMESLNDRLDHMHKNFPAVLNQPQSQPPKGIKEEVSATPVVSKKVKKPAQIKYLTLSEFESVPKYMKGRLQYNQINTFIDTFNKVISTKYKLLSMPRKLMKPADYKICNVMKMQETEETKGSYFCTGENLKEYGNVLMDKSTNNFITILRHCKRLKEIRGPGPIIRYVIIT